MKAVPWQESPRQKLLVIPIVLVVIASIVLAWWWQSTPEYKAQEHREALPYRLAGLQNMKEELEDELNRTNIRLREVLTEIRKQPDAQEILAEAEHIRRIAQEDYAQ